MTRRRRITPFVIAVALCATALPALAPAVGAQKPKPAKGKAKTKGKLRAGLYSGGALAGSPQYVELRVGKTRRRATETATLSFDCGRVRPRVIDTLSVRRTVLHGGRTSFDAPVLEEVPDEVPGIGGLRRKGSVTGKLRVDRDGTAHGSVRSRFTLTDPTTRKRVARCDSGTVRWQARLGVGRLGTVEPGRSVAERGADYFGRTTQRRPLTLSVAAGGRAVRRIGMTFDVRCPSALGRRLQLDVADVAIARRGRKRGSFHKTGTFSRSFVDPAIGPVRESYRWRLAGRFGPRSVGGGWKVSGRVTSAEGSSSCTTGRNRWRAVR